MRQLAAGQRLVLAGTTEVVSRSSTVKSVLEMIAHNTVRMTGKALPVFLDHGRNYLTFPNSIELPVYLQHMYGRPTGAHRNFIEYLDSQQSLDVHGDAEAYEALYSYCKKIGEGLVVQTGGLNQECERELEEEVEQQNEQEEEIADKQPFGQQEDWLFQRCLDQPDSLFDSIFRPFQDFVSARLPGLEKIKWSKNLYCTTNFWKTIEDGSFCPDMSLYLRPVNAIVAMEDGRVVLVSLFELDRLLPHYWEAAKNSVSSQNHSSILQLSRILKPENPSFGFEDHCISLGVLTSIKLFCGMVDYTQEEKQVLANMFETVRRPRKVVEEILKKRHRLVHFERSELEEFCDRMHGR
jgi:hypothetical protein